MVDFDQMMTSDGFSMANEELLETAWILENAHIVIYNCPPLYPAMTYMTVS